MRGIRVPVVALRAGAVGNSDLADGELLLGDYCPPVIPSWVSPTARAGGV